VPSSKVSQSDLEFQRAFESGQVPPGDFNHLAHLRLAYVYIAQGGVQHAEQMMRESLLEFLLANGIPREKFHETLTRAWLMAVAHFMSRQSSESFPEFIGNSQPLLDTKVMLTHYSSEALFSDRARAAFVEPDIEPIPHP
jgi:hypothetical protein